MASEKKEKLKASVSSFSERYGRRPSLRLISAGDDQASLSYIRSKIKYGKSLGLNVEHSSMGSNVSESELKEEIDKHSREAETNGIVLESPLPEGLDHTSIAQSISPGKDLDCITEVNQGRITLNREFLLPATANSIMTLIEMQDLPRGSIVTVINRSPVIGRPLAMMLLNRDYTVNVCHSKTGNIPRIAREGDVVVVGVGKPGFLTSDYVTERTTVVDAGINFVDGKMRGDADFDNLENLVKAITPVPGGVGPVTTAIMFENLLKASEWQMKNFGGERSA